MKSINTEDTRLAKRVQKGNRNVFLWTSLWLVNTALVAYGPKQLWDFNVTVTWIAVMFNIVTGLAMLNANKNLILAMDELQQKIHFNAMAISLGFTLLFGTLYGLLEPAGLVSTAPNSSNILFVMGISYLIAMAINYRKYG